jgi:hypothetical protein
MMPTITKPTNSFVVELQRGEVVKIGSIQKVSEVAIFYRLSRYRVPRNLLIRYSNFNLPIHAKSESLDEISGNYLTFDTVLSRGVRFVGMGRLRNETPRERVCGSRGDVRMNV